MSEQTPENHHNHATPGFDPPTPAPPPDNRAAHYPSQPPQPAASSYQYGQSYGWPAGQVPQPNPQAYPQQPTYSTPYHPQPGYASTPYAFQQPGGYYAEPVPPKKSPLLGIIMFALAIVGSIMIAFPWSQVTFTQLRTLENIDPSAEFEQLPSWFMAIVYGLLLGAVMLIVSFIGSIVAIITKRGILWSIFAIIACFILPFAGMGIAFQFAGLI